MVCGLRFVERGLSEVEVARYYRNYRDAEYVGACRLPARDRQPTCRFGLALP